MLKTKHFWEGALFHIRGSLGFSFKGWNEIYLQSDYKWDSDTCGPLSARVSTTSKKAIWSSDYLQRR